MTIINSAVAILIVISASDGANAQGTSPGVTIAINENTPASKSQTGYRYECGSHRLVFDYSTDTLRRSRLGVLTIDDLSLRDGPEGRMMDQTVAYLVQPFVLGVTCSHAGFTIVMSNLTAFSPEIPSGNQTTIYLPMTRR